jgi:hypothetical protein
LSPELGSNCWFVALIIGYEGFIVFLQCHMNVSMFFIKAVQNKRNLAEVAADVFRSLGMKEWEERHSANYPPSEHYFAGYAKNACVQVYDCDDVRTPDYPFQLEVGKPTWRVGSGIIDINPPTIAKLLVAGGFIVFVPHGAWYQKCWDGDGEVYAA